MNSALIWINSWISIISLHVDFVNRTTFSFSLNIILNDSKKSPDFPKRSGKIKGLGRSAFMKCFHGQLVIPELDVGNLVEILIFNSSNDSTAFFCKEAALLTLLIFDI